MACLPWDYPPGAFLVIALIAAYLGFGKVTTGKVNDKFLHFITFFFLTVSS